MVLRYPAISVAFKENGLSFQTEGTITDAHYNLNEWLLLVHALSYLASGSGSIEIEFRGARTPPTLVPAGLSGPYVDELPALAEFLDGWRHILELAGADIGDGFHIGDVWEASDVSLAIEVIERAKPSAFVEFDNVDGILSGLTMTAIYFNSCSFAGAAVSYSARVRLDAVGGEGRNIGRVASRRSTCDPPWSISMRMGKSRRSCMTSMA